MTVTALTPHIGYDNAARVAHLAHERGITLREACAELGVLSEADFDRLYKPEEMI
jgi:fumarate hydratase class II